MSYTGKKQFVIYNQTKRIELAQYQYMLKKSSELLKTEVQETSENNEIINYGIRYKWNIDIISWDSDLIAILEELNCTVVNFKEHKDSDVEYEVYLQYFQDDIHKYKTSAFLKIELTAKSVSKYGESYNISTVTNQYTAIDQTEEFDKSTFVLTNGTVQFAYYTKTKTATDISPVFEDETLLTGELVRVYKKDTDGNNIFQKKISIKLIDLTKAEYTTLKTLLTGNKQLYFFPKAETQKYLPCQAVFKPEKDSIFRDGGTLEIYSASKYYYDDDVSVYSEADCITVFLPADYWSDSDCTLEYSSNPYSTADCTLNYNTSNDTMAICNPEYVGYLLSANSICYPYYEGNMQAICYPSFAGSLGSIAYCLPEYQGYMEAICYPVYAGNLEDITLCWAEYQGYMEAICYPVYTGRLEDFAILDAEYQGYMQAICYPVFINQIAPAVCYPSYSGYMQAICYPVFSRDDIPAICNVTFQKSCLIGGFNMTYTEETKMLLLENRAEGAWRNTTTVDYCYFDLLKNGAGLTRLKKNVELYYLTDPATYTVLQVVKNLDLPAGDNSKVISRVFVIPGVSNMAVNTTAGSKSVSIVITWHGVISQITFSINYDTYTSELESPFGVSTNPHTLNYTYADFGVKRIILKVFYNSKNIGTIEKIIKLINYAP